MTAKLFQIEVRYGAMRYLVNVYGTRVGKIFFRRTFKGKEQLQQLEQGTEIYNAVKAKADAMLADFKQDRKKR